jgi:hypothetical protein
MSVQAAKGNFNPATDIVTVRGWFNGWTPGDTMDDGNSDLIYTKSFSFTPGDSTYFKFAYHDVSKDSIVWENMNNRIYVYPPGGGVYQDYFERDSVSPTPSTSCPSNILLNGGFTNGMTSWSAAYGSPDFNWIPACGDSGFVAMWGNQFVGEGLQQSVTFDSGKTYTISFCGRWAQEPNRPYPPRYMFRASNTQLVGPQDGNGTLIGLSELFSTPNTWVPSDQITWTPSQNYSLLTINVTNQSSANNGDSVTYAYIDNVCVVENVITGSICGFKFNDINCNGVWDAGEPGLPGWTINLTGSSTASTTTDANGNYCFNNLSAGTYTICEVQQPGCVQTLPAQSGCYSVNLTAGQTVTGKNFGNCCQAQSECTPCDTCFVPGPDLITNGDFSSGNSGFISALTYVSTGTLSDGKYSIRTDASTANGGWTGTDHTTGSGNFMVCDGISGSQTIPAWRQSIPVKANTKYVFCAWVNNLDTNSNLSNPVLEMRVNGTIVGTALSIPLYPDNWVLMSASWQSTIAGTVTVDIVSTSTDYFGNDFGIDDISFRECVPKITANAGADQETCVGKSVMLSATGGTSCSWTPAYLLTNPNSCSPTFTPTYSEIFNFVVTVSDSNGCYGIDTVKITVDSCFQCTPCDTCFVPGPELVTNGNFSSGNSGFTSALTYVSTGIISQGKYSIRTDASTANGGWTGTDHTTGSGNFMVCDGISGGQTVPAWRESIPVKANTNYTFCAWVNNLNTSTMFSNPILELRVNGTLVGTALNLPVNPDVWVLMSGSWNSGSTSGNVNVDIVSTSIESMGNDFGIDDISFRECVPKITANAGSDKNTCVGQTVMLSATGGTSCSWSPAYLLTNPNTCSPSFTPTYAGVFNFVVTVTDSNGCYGIDTVKVTVDSCGCTGCGVIQTDGIVTPSSFSGSQSTFNITGTPNANVIVSFSLATSMSCTDNATIALSYNSTSGYNNTDGIYFNPTGTYQTTIDSTGHLQLSVGTNFCVTGDLCGECTATIIADVQYIVAKASGIHETYIGEITLRCDSCTNSTSVSVSVNSSWNIISVPVKASDYTKSNLFPTATSPAFTFAGSYMMEPTLRNGVGYWMKFPSAQTIQIEGWRTRVESLTVAEGWNMVGSISYRTRVESLTTEPATMTVSPFFGYNRGYIICDTIVPGQGYWVKSDTAGIIILNSGSSGLASKNRIRIKPTSELPPPPPEGDGNTSETSNLKPEMFALEQAYPNPFNPFTVIGYQLPVRSSVTLKVIDLLGREIAVLFENEVKDAGRYSANFNASELPSGMYFYKISAQGEDGTTWSDVKKFVLLK